MTIKKPWKVVGGTLAAAVTLGSTAAVAQSGNAMPDTIDLDDVVTIDQVTQTTIASLFSDTPTVTLDDSIASISDGIDDETDDDDDDSSPSAESPDDTDDDSSPSAESPDDTADDSSPSAESPDDTADDDDSPDDSPDSDDSDD